MTGTYSNQHELWTIWVRRPRDPGPWLWGGSYDDPDGTLCAARLEELRVEYPRWSWEARPPTAAEEQAA